MVGEGEERLAASPRHSIGARSEQPSPASPCRLQASRCPRALPSHVLAAGQGEQRG